MDDITVIHRMDDAFAVIIRDHVIHVDQPYSAGGMDAGPSPLELFVAGLAACAAHDGRRYLAAHGLPAEGLRARVRFSVKAGSPERVVRVDLVMEPPVRLSERDAAELQAAIRRCTVHNTFTEAPRIAVDVAASEPVA
ncbi:hypothetical protein GCM10023085_20680 [Actinomadura viridis]|uniref:OsmC-like protein n=1 Tax=Actinomadura viridis TaxID=58110 RepID=A0A931DLC2_9ACTN|nr:OsmC family protein [Actinomadura viridis]MBG6089175.1 putative OsmC-like protein [Actinomadura viridis]